MAYIPYLDAENPVSGLVLQGAKKINKYIDGAVLSGTAKRVLYDLLIEAYDKGFRAASFEMRGLCEKLTKINSGRIPVMAVVEEQSG